MDDKTTRNSTSNDLVGDKEVAVDGSIYYIAVTGFLGASDCVVFGLKKEEDKALGSKYARTHSVSGVAFKTNVLDAINSLAQLGYKIIASTGEKEITWTMLREE